VIVSRLRHQIADIAVDALAHKVLVLFEPPAGLGALREIIVDHGQTTDSIKSVCATLNVDRPASDRHSRFF
jgi:hypothetical protein